MSLASWFYDLFNTPEPEMQPGAILPQKPAKPPLSPVAAKLIACIEAGDFNELPSVACFGGTRTSYAFALSEDLAVEVTITVYWGGRDEKKTLTCKIANLGYALSAADREAILAAFEAKEAADAKIKLARLEAAQAAAIARIEAYVPRVTTEQQNNPA